MERRVWCPWGQGHIFSGPGKIRVTCSREGNNIRVEVSLPSMDPESSYLLIPPSSIWTTSPTLPSHFFPALLPRNPWLAARLRAGQQELTGWQTAFFTSSQYEQGPKTMIPNIWISSICDLSSYIGIPQSPRQSNAAGFINTSNTLSV